jgi:hypothetical protein
MTQNDKTTDYTVKLRPRGGAGRSAIWQWEVYGQGKLLPLVKGTSSGSQSKAQEDGQKAIDRLKAAK